jgi:hypothetical protein
MNSHRPLASVCITLVPFNAVASLGYPSSRGQAAERQFVQVFELPHLGS